MENPDGGNNGDQRETKWQFSSSEDKGQPANLQTDEPAPQQTEKKQKPSSGSVSWSAVEFIEHGKGANWYLLLLLATAVFAGLIFLLTRDKITTGIIIFCALVFGVYAARKPRTLNYVVDEHGFMIGEKFYAYASFRSYSLIDEGQMYSLLLLPLRRFMPMITVYYEKKDENKIIDVISRHLPLDNRGHDTMEQFLRRIKF